jgi:16S rRNA (uracil1498-N3)-methyltransferase
MTNLLVTPAELDRAEIEVTGDAYHHAFHAARGALGDLVRVVDGRGRARNGAVVGVDRRRAVVRLGDRAPPLEPRLRVELLVATPRPSRASWLVEKATELGVGSFCFLECARGERPLDGAAIERLRRVASAAVVQCGRSWLPEVSGPEPLAEALEASSPAGGALLLLDPAAPGSLAAVSLDCDQPLRIVVGPEGGLTPAEVELGTRGGARPVRLVPAVLRVETAAIAAATWALLQCEREPLRASEGRPAARRSL